MTKNHQKCHKKHLMRSFYDKNIAIMHELFGKFHADFYTVSINCAHKLNFAPIFRNK